MTISLRQMTPTDIAMVDSILIAAYASPGSFQEELSHYLVLQPDGWFIALLDGRPVGAGGTVNYGPFSYLGLIAILPDLQSCVLCEDVRHEFNGMQTLVGVVNVVPAPQLPITCMRLCIWSRWCSGSGKFKQRSRIVGVDEQQVIAQAEVEFELKEMEGHATNVHYFGGVQFQQFGLHHVEIYLEDELRLRFPLPVVRIQRK